MEIIYYSKGVN